MGESEITFVEIFLTFFRVKEFPEPFGYFYLSSDLSRLGTNTDGFEDLKGCKY